MLFWDPYFGWDFFAMRQAIFSLVVFCLLVSFVATTEGERWFRPYEWVYEALIANAAATIGVTAILFVMGFWYWRFQMGDM